MKEIDIYWQRLVDEKGYTCDRCNKTYLNLERAIKKLMPFLNSIGIELNFQTKALSKEEFIKDPLSSNEIIINGKNIERILNLKKGQSNCCGPCEDNQCMTIIEEGVEKEEIEERLIIKAILKEVIDIL